MFGNLFKGRRSPEGESSQTPTMEELESAGRLGEGVREALESGVYPKDMSYEAIKQLFQLAPQNTEFTTDEERFVEDFNMHAGMLGRKDLKINLQEK